MARQLFTTPTGMRDILPDDQPYWDRLRQVVFDAAGFYDFAYVETPILEDRGIFEKSLGLANDVVEKEMYTLKTKGGDELALRPEGTAPIMRAYLQHGWESLPQPVKVFYVGPMFRHESPQAGRYRQFYQFGFEALGADDVVLDAQLIQLAMSVLGDVGLKNVVCEVNSLGDKTCRVKYRQSLKDFLRSHIKKMCADCQRRYKTNPLRVLDCKEETCREIIAKAPQILDFICEACRGHFKKLLEFLDELDIPYMLNPYLVRGLDYYAKTVFEIYPARDDVASGVNVEEKRPAQSALVAGGRYDGLAEILGGKDVPAVGFAGGMERVIREMKEAAVKVPARPSAKIFLVQLGELAKRRCLKVLEEFRRNGILAAEALSKHSIKSQMKIADKLGVKLALILGQKEALDNEMIIRDMDSGVQETIPLAKLIGEVKKRLRSN